MHNDEPNEKPETSELKQRVTPRRTSLLMAITTILLVALVYACQSTTVEPPEEPPTDEPPPVSETGIECTPDVLEPVQVELRPESNDYFVDGQLIVTGPPDAVREVVQEAGLDPDPIQACNIEYGEDTKAALADFPQPDALAFPAGAPLALNLYQTEAGSVIEAVARVNEAAARLNVPVTADPNFIIFPSPGAYQPAGDPWQGQAPEPTGSGTVDPYGELFCNQWAFQELGITCADEGGAEQIIAVFDTSPFPASDTYNVGGWSLPVTNNDLNIEFVPDAPPAEVVDVHGLFVARLALAAAPNAEVQLIQVLDEYALGDLFSMNRILQSYIFEQQRQGNLGRLVINLSLGTHQPTDLETLGLNPALDNQIESLQQVLASARAGGATIVAAAGNDSEAVEQAQQFPAAYRFVTGVAAEVPTTTVDPGTGPILDFERACYANSGDVQAPGGNGCNPREENQYGCEPDLVEQENGTKVSNPNEDVCALGFDACPAIDEGVTDGSVCPYGLVSIIVADEKAPGYGYWAGSSFATPLVSGLAARLRVAGVSPADVTAQVDCILSALSDDPELLIADAVEQCVSR